MDPRQVRGFYACGGRHESAAMIDRSGTPENQTIGVDPAQPGRRRTSLRAALALVGFLFLLAATVLVAGGQPDPAVQHAVAAVTTTERPSSTPTT